MDTEAAGVMKQMWQRWIPDYEELASSNKLIIGRPNDFEKTSGVQPEVGVPVILKIFSGNHSKNMHFKIAAILDGSKIGNIGRTG